MSKVNFFEKKLRKHCTKAGNPCFTPAKNTDISLRGAGKSKSKSKPSSRKSKLYITNPDKIEVYTVQVDCLIKENTRCDWAVYSDSCCRLLLIELKKGDAGYSADQLTATAKFFGQPKKTLCILASKSKYAPDVEKKLKRQGLSFKSLGSNKVTKRNSANLTELLKYENPKAHDC